MNLLLASFAWVVLAQDAAPYAYPPPAEVRAASFWLALIR